jgi:hypothetical protein
MLKNGFDLESIERKSVILVSEYNGLSISLLEKLLSSFFRVTVFCGKKELWFLKAPYLKDNHFLSFSEGKKEETFDYLVFISSFFDNLSRESESDILGNEKTRLNYCNTIFNIREKNISLLPYSVFDELSRELVFVYEESFKREDSSLKNIVFYLGNLIGPRLILNNRDETSLILKSIIERSILEIPVSPSSIVRPTKVADVSRQITNMLVDEDFSFFRTLVSGKPIVLEKWLKEGFSNYFKDFNYSFSVNSFGKLDGVFDREVLLEDRVDFNFLRQTINWFKKNKDDFYFDNRLTLVKVHLEDTEKNKNSNLSEKILVSKERKIPKRPFFRYQELFSWFIGIFSLLKNIFSVLERKFKLYFKINKAKIIERTDTGATIKNIEKNHSKFNEIIRRVFWEKKVIGKFVFLKRKNDVSAKKNLNSNLSFLQKYIVFGLSAIITLVLIPLVSLFLAIFSFYIGQNLLKKGSFEYARRLFYFNGKLSSFSLSQLYFYSEMPVIGKPFVYVGQLAKISYQSSEVALSLIESGQKAIFLVQKSINGQEISLDEYSRDLILNLDFAYQKLSFLEGEIKYLKDRWPFSYFAKYVDKIDLPRRREEIQTAKMAASLLGNILGQNGEKKYLVLFQNNMEIRPTGGFIGSFAIISFNRGAMTNFEVYDVYSADGQLKGYVDPPWQLKKYLDQPAWYLRDSNWDPDFPVSAQRAEWFLDKSIDLQVDGVVAVDLFFTRSLVEKFGSVYVRDYDKRIDAKNFYEVVQYEAEKDFFPGSRQKENFLLALSRSLINSFKSVDSKQSIMILGSFYESLNQRHVQVFLHEGKLQERIDSLGWSGALDIPTCPVENCLSDFVSLIEANLGVNKANYFIDREVKVGVDVNKDTVNRSLEINFKNRAPSFFADKSLYKVYLRLILPVNVEVKNVFIDNSIYSFDQELIKGRKEIGVYLEVPSSSEKKVVFEWDGGYKIDLEKNGEYRFYFRKQAGIDSIPFSINVNFPQNFLVGRDSSFRLTDGGGLLYNQTILKKDFTTRFYW